MLLPMRIEHRIFIFYKIVLTFFIEIYNFNCGKDTKQKWKTMRREECGGIGNDSKSSGYR